VSAPASTVPENATASAGELARRVDLCLDAAQIETALGTLTPIDPR
jgi:hypothetical protein